MTGLAVGDRSERPLVAPSRGPRPRRSTARWSALDRRLLLGLLALTAICFCRVVTADFTHWDDPVYVIENPLVHSLSSDNLIAIATAPAISNYHPLTLLSYSLEYALVGASPWLYHLDNLLLHLVAVCFAFALSRRVLHHGLAGRGGDSTPGNSTPEAARTEQRLATLGATFATAMFALHPLRVESVAWIAERKDVLCAAFSLAALVAYERHLDRPRARSWLAVLGLLLAALLSKAMAITLPVVCVLLAFRRGALNRRRLLELTPLAVLSLLFALLAVHAQALNDSLHGLRGGTLSRHLASVLVGLQHDVSKLLLPVSLSSRYDLDPATGPLDPRALAGGAILVAAIAAAVVSSRRRRLAGLGIASALVLGAPVCGIAPTSTLVADRYSYLPSIGVTWALWAAVRASLPVVRPRALAVGITILALAWGALSARRVEAWQDGLALWRDALAVDPDNRFAHQQLGTELLIRGRYREALQHHSRAIAGGLSEPRLLFNLCLTHRGLGDFERERQCAEAILAAHPDFLPALEVRLRALRVAGRMKECARTISEALARHGEAPLLLLARGDLALAQGDPRRALADYASALAARPNRELGLAAAVAWALLGEADTARALREAVLAGATDEFLPGERVRLARLDELLGTVRDGNPRGSRVGSPHDELRSGR